MKNKISVSLHKIAEFTYASSARREEIVKDQKKKPTCKVAGYKHAAEFLPPFFANGQNPAELQTKIDNLINLNAGTPRDELRNAICGLRAIQDMIPIDLIGFAVHPLPYNLSDGIIIGNVYINARPDFLVSKTIRGKSQLGAFKFSFPKQHTMSDNVGKCAAILLFEYLRQANYSFGVPKDSLCHIVDVFPNSIFVAPKSYIRVMRELDAACRLYEMLWLKL